MSMMTSALSNVFNLDRQRARFSSDRLVDVSASAGGAEEEGQESSSSAGAAVVHGGGISGSGTAAATSSSTTARRRSGGGRRSSALRQHRPVLQQQQQQQEDLEAGSSTAAAAAAAALAVEQGTSTAGSSVVAGNAAATAAGAAAAVVGPEEDDDLEDVAMEEEEEDDDDRLDGDDLEAAAAFHPVLASAAASGRATITLAELEEERELARRRSSVCILLAAFVLFRLWVLAISEGDAGLLLLCLVGTSWTARWISYNREREEELDRRIANYLENSEAGANADGVDRNDLRMLSFQAQLALAIMESQRQMMQGGYGHPDGEGNRDAGVSDEAKARWERFKFQSETSTSASNPAPSSAGNKDHHHQQHHRASVVSNSNKGKYGSVSQKDDDLLLVDGDGPHCSICLSEYEDGDDVVKLPCKHVYHEECISSWTSNHVKCPLCNYDLMAADPSLSAASGGGASAVDPARPASAIDTIV